MREDKDIERERMNKRNSKFEQIWWMQEEKLRLLHKIKEAEDTMRWRKQRTRNLRAEIKQLKSERKRDFVTCWKSDVELDVEFNKINSYTDADPVLCWVERFT